MNDRRGFTLVEMLIAMVAFLFVLAAAMQGLKSQSNGFTRGADEMGILQNMRYGAELLDQEFRMAGANVPDRQPSVVYAGPNSFSFNADMVSDVLGDISSVYVDPDALPGQVQAWRLANAAVVPNSSAAFTYPLFDFATSGGETLTFWFSLDTETARADDYVLNRQVNNQNPEVLVRGILAPSGGQNFFKYFYLNAPVGVNATIDSVPTAWGNLRHVAAQHGVLPDTGILARVDQLRAVQVRFRVTNQRAGTAERIREINSTIPLPNVGVKKLQTCGDAPIFGSAVGAAYDGVATPARVRVTWVPSVDEATGEQDIIRYVVWRKLAAAVDWGDPYTSIASGAAPPYIFDDTDLVSTATYNYAVSAQDCTPLLSTKRVTANVVIP
ncbi:MAG: prepilin-type N-terminal cleavage/methylation domain-containing protein [Gemmatimonadales bacterium]|nr:prepilin-type N-terminal cleavage/methylation domain-containing protein [Gemmatimonadales bacterium]